MSDDLMNKTLRYRWIIFWILACGYILVYFHRLCPAIVAVDMMADFAAGGTLLGILGSAYFYPYAIMQLPAGLLADSWGPRRTITLSFSVAFAGSLLMGLAPSVFWAVAGRTMVGLGVSMLFVSTMKILAEWFRAGEFAFMTGILMAMGGIGSLAAATPLALLSAWVGWRLSFVAVGGGGPSCWPCPCGRLSATAPQIWAGLRRRVPRSPKPLPSAWRKVFDKFWDHSISGPWRAGFSLTARYSFHSGGSGAGRISCTFMD